MSTKTKRILFRLTSMLGDGLALMSYFSLGYYAHYGMSLKLITYMSLFLIGTGVKVLATISDRALWKINVEQPKTGDPYRDAQEAIYSRVAELETELAAEKKAAGEKRPFPFEYVMCGVGGGMVLLLLFVALVSAFTDNQK